jgi:OmpA-OmpF porin, OOP family
MPQAVKGSRQPDILSCGRSGENQMSLLLITLALVAPGDLLAQQEGDRNIIVEGDVADMVIPEDAPKGPEIKGIIGARSGNRIQVVMPDGSSNIIAFNETTKIRSSKGLFSRAKLDGGALLNGLPVTIKTVQAGEALFARQISLRNGDLKTANMIKTGTAQGFAEQTAATAALRGRMGDIDQYNIKGTTNVNFDVGKHNLTEQGKADLCATASAADGMKNAMLLVVGYTDSTGDDDYNQKLSEQRASRVVNHLQQACGWKPYRMLTPTGMSESDPMASNDTAEGKAQNRRVAVNILVSKGLDGL